MSDNGENILREMRQMRRDHEQQLQEVRAAQNQSRQQLEAMHAAHQQQLQLANEARAAEQTAFQQQLREANQALAAAQEQVRNQNNQGIPRGLKKGAVPTFAGKATEDPVTFCFMAEQYHFDNVELQTANNEQFTQLVASGSLQEPARTWFQNYSANAKAEGETRTWEHFKTALVSAYGKINVKGQAIRDALTLKQSSTVQNYETRLTSLLLKSGIKWPEEIKVELIQLAVKPAIQMELQRRLPRNMAEAVQIARAEEARLKQLPKQTTEKPDPTQPRISPGKQPKKTLDKSEGVVCYACGKKGHKRPDCEAPDEEKAAYKTKRDADKKKDSK